MKLPKFLYKALISHRTSLGENEAFPPEEDYIFEYKIIKHRFKEVSEKVSSIGDVDSSSIDSLVNYLGKLMKECKEKEKPIRENLVKLCVNIVNESLNVPSETVNLNCKLVDSLKSENPLRVMPETSDKRGFDFDDIADFKNASKVIMKRRLINSLVMGVSYKCGELYKEKKKEIDELNPDLFSMYEKIIAINDYLLFVKEEKISDDKQSQGAIVEVMLGRDGDKTDINVQGLIFPFLLSEAFRGFFELFASHGLPNDIKKVNYIIKQADFLLAEPWDIRLGVPLWEIIGDGVMDTTLLPFYFSELCKKKTDDFNDSMQEILAKTKRGKMIIDDMKTSSEENKKMLGFMSKINTKNAETSVLTDAYLSSDELDSYIIDDNDGSVIEEDNDDKYEKIILSATVDNIDFYEEELDIIRQFQIHVIIKGVEIPTSIIDFKLEPRNVLGETLYQCHIFLNDEKIRNKQLCFKIYKKAILTYGNLYSGYRRRLNNNEIPKIWEKLRNEPNIDVSEVIGRNGEPIGIKAILKQ